MIGNDNVQLYIQGCLLASDLKATASINNSWAASAGNALHNRSQWLLEDYADLTWDDLRILLPKLFNLKVLVIDAHALGVSEEYKNIDWSWIHSNWDVHLEPQLSEARELITDVVWRNELLHVDVCNNIFWTTDSFIDLFEPVAGQLLSLRTESNDFSMDLAHILQACGQLKQLDVENLSLDTLFYYSRPPKLPALPMLEKLRVKDVDLDRLASLFYDENPFTAVRQRLPRLQEIHVKRRIWRGVRTQVPQSLLDEVRLAIHIRPGKRRCFRELLKSTAASESC